ncbi:Dephospho-CoA kinase [Liberibacter crescens BT-1]|uniref:Dephospho-CoA kinase n=2 Tax=Liberibacter crescens TaxID=1273132 RepID=L0EWX2_LIBCB|nr:dephospho-CoA kinase [Liberibacter crescens]AGA65365.1 Dephospho-CoA kinase [Liberibacter crescens BT-1]AMC13265.1 dephospho-CoA kinase [Liberibacter crescens]
MIILGITGSIGTGKTTVSNFFKENGVSVISADDIVNDLYQGSAVTVIENNFPGSTKDNKVDKEILFKKLNEEPEKFKILENIIHPMIRIREREILKDFFYRGEKIVVFESPLLFETRRESFFDKIILVHCSLDIQRSRVLARENFTEEKFFLILSRQIDAKYKILRVDYIINTQESFDKTRDDVCNILNDIYRTYNLKKKNA